MADRFIVLAERPSVDFQKRITSFLSTEQLGYWHWFQDSWLVSSMTPNRWSEASLRDKFMELCPDLHFIVIKASNDPTDWAAFGNTKSFDWMKSEWV